MRIKFIIQILAFSIFIISCSGVKESTYSDCVKPYMKNFVIRWGECIKEGDAVKGYELRPDGKIRRYLGLKDSSFTIVGEVESSEFCRYFQMLNDTITKIPTLYSPGDFNRFVELHSPQKKYFFRALWNMNYQTYGSYCYRVIFDSLNVLLEKSKEK